MASDPPLLEWEPGGPPASRGVVHLSSRVSIDASFLAWLALIALAAGTVLLASKPSDVSMFAVAAAVAATASLVLHEAAHAIVALSRGYSVGAAWAYGASLGIDWSRPSHDAAPSDIAAVSIAGPAANILIALVALAALLAGWSTLVVAAVAIPNVTIAAINLWPRTIHCDLSHPLTDKGVPTDGLAFLAARRMSDLAH